MTEGKRDVPLGSDFLRVVREQEQRCEDTLNEWLPSAGVKAPQTMDRLGTALSYEDVVRNDFSPGMVRKKLESLPLPLPMNRETYGLLSTQSIHVNPDTSPQSHNPFSLPTLGGYFQEAGALVALNHLAGMVGWMLWLAVVLVKPPTDRKVIADASVSLLRSIGGVKPTLDPRPLRRDSRVASIREGDRAVEAVAEDAGKGAEGLTQPCETATVVAKFFPARWIVALAVIPGRVFFYASHRPH